MLGWFDSYGHLTGLGNDAPMRDSTQPLVQFRWDWRVAMMEERADVDAVILVGGLGTRLRPLTLSAPKPMLPTAGVPLLAHLLSRIRDAGVTHIVLGTSYQSDVFASYFGDGRQFGMELEYVVESRAPGHGRRHPQCREPIAGRHHARFQRGRPERRRPGCAARSSCRHLGGRDALPHDRRRRPALRLRADRRGRPGHRVPGEGSRTRCRTRSTPGPTCSGAR